MGAALAFLTTLGGSRRPAPGALRWFPAVGAVVGAVLATVWWGAGELWPPLVAAVLVLAVELALTGLLHVDGLADSADGLLAHGVDRDRRLAIMRTGDVGAFGVAVVAVVLLGRVAALASLSPEPLLLVGLWTASRTVMAVTPALVPYAREDGLASPFLEPKPTFLPALALVPAVALAVVAMGAPGSVAVVALVVAAGGVVAVARRRLGGFTGDVLGAAALVGESAGLIVASARW